MNEVKMPKRLLLFYYGITMLVLILFNSLVLPRIVQEICLRFCPQYASAVKCAKQIRP